MYKLLNAGFTRLRKSKVFYVLLIYTIGLSLFMLYTQYSNMKKYDAFIELDQLLLNNIPIIGIAISIFIALFIGREYSDGTLRNKIILGSSRIKIYLSNLLIVAITSLFTELLHLAITTVIGINIFGTLNMSIGTFGMILIDIIGIILAFSSIFTFVAMIISNKTISSIVSILVAFGLMILSVTILSRIEAPEYINSAQITNSETQEVEMIQEKNPKYLTEKQRKYYQMVLNFIPSGQAFMIAGRIDTNFNILPFYSLGVIIVFTVAGIYLFNKKELN